MKALESQNVSQKRSSRQQMKKSFSFQKTVGLQKEAPERECKRGQTWCVWQDPQAQRDSCLTP